VAAVPAAAAGNPTIEMTVPGLAMTQTFLAERAQAVKVGVDTLSAIIVRVHRPQQGLLPIYSAPVLTPVVVPARGHQDNDVICRKMSHCMTFEVGTLDPTVPLKLKFRELLDEEATIAALVDRIAPSAPPATALSAPEPLPAPSAPFVSPPAAVTHPVTGAERSATSWSVDASTLTHLLGHNAQDTPLCGGPAGSRRTGK
jgi:hypothetical protein